MYNKSQKHTLPRRRIANSYTLLQVQAANLVHKFVKNE